MHIKASRQYPTRGLLANYKLCNFIVCVLTLYAMVIYDQIFVDFIGFLSPIIYVVLYTQC